MTLASLISLPESHCSLADRHDVIGRGGMLSFPVTGIADAEDLQVVKRRREFLTGADVELPLLQLGIIELDHRSAGGTDEVIVMGVATDVLVVVVVLTEVNAS